MMAPHPSQDAHRPPPKLVSVVVPFLNEAEGLPRLIQELASALNDNNQPWELVLVDDGSQDRSLAVARAELARWPRLTAQLLSLTRNFGKEAALTAGLEASRGTVIVPLDADLQDPPSLIRTMVETWRQGYDVVYAVRRRREGEGWMKRFTAFAFYRLISRVSDTDIPADTGDFRLMDRCVVDALLQMQERTRFMKGLFAWVGFQQTAIYYDRDARCEGRSSWNYWKIWNFAVDGLTSFSRVPLQVIGSTGSTFAIAAFGYGAWIIARTMLFGVDLPGYASLLTIILLLGGVQLISIGVLGEYLGRIFIEVKRRPLYLIRSREELGPRQQLNKPLT